MNRNKRASRDLFTSNSKHISSSSTQRKKIRKRIRSEKSFENYNSSLMNGQKVTNPSISENEPYADRPSASSLYRPAPFNDDPEAVEIRAKCDYSIKITKETAASGKAPRPVRVYADGIYDLFHQGHAQLLMQAKNAFPSVYLIAGVNSDLVTHQNKGKTVMTESERYEIVRHCRYVDEVVKDADWIPHDRFLEENKIDFVAHDDLPYALGSQGDIYKHLKDKGIFVATERAKGISTSDLVARIVRNYDLYVHRNLSRGYTGKDLYLSFIYEKKIFLQNKIDKVREMFVKKIRAMLSEWRENAKTIANSFLNLFGKICRMNFIWNERLAQTPTESPMKRREMPSSTTAEPLVEWTGQHRKVSKTS